MQTFPEPSRVCRAVPALSVYADTAKQGAVSPFSLHAALSEIFSGFIHRPAPAVDYYPVDLVAVWFSGISNAEQAAHNAKFKPGLIAL